jgi:hypothetical protein
LGGRGASGDPQIQCIRRFLCASPIQVAGRRACPRPASRTGRPIRCQPDLVPAYALMTHLTRIRRARMACAAALRIVRTAMLPPTRRAAQVRAAALGCLHVLCADAPSRAACRTALAAAAAPAAALAGARDPGARAAAAAVLGDAALDAAGAARVAAQGGIEALLLALGPEPGPAAAAARLEAAQALGLLALHAPARARLLRPAGLAAAVCGAGGSIAALEGLLRGGGAGAGGAGGDWEEEAEEAAAAAVTALVNLGLDDAAALERIAQSGVAGELVRGIPRYGAHFRAEAACLLALLAGPEENRPALGRVAARAPGGTALGVVGALALALCTEGAATDARGACAAVDARAAAASGLCRMARFGGLEEVVQLVRHGAGVAKTAAAMTLWKLARQDPDRGLLLDVGVVPDVIEMLIAAGDAEARVNAAGVLSTISERSEGESVTEARARIRRVCAVVPRLGVSAVYPVINVLLRSADERQRAAAARALAAWCLDEELAARIWEEGHEGLLDVLLTDTVTGLDEPALLEGVACTARLLRRVCSFEALRPGVAGCVYLHDARERSAFQALRNTLRTSTDPSTVTDAAATLQALGQHGGLEQLAALLLADDGDAICLKACASVLQPMCSKEAGRRRVAECTGKEETEISAWISCFILADTRS